MQTPSRHNTAGFLSRVGEAVEERLETLSDRPQLAAAALIGLVLGLSFGLVIGWVLWPVAYENAYPADLSADAKAQFIAAVADAYVASGGDVGALDTARARLTGVTAADLESARRYFIETSLAGSEAVTVGEPITDPVYQQTLRADGNIRINNINRLANDLNIPLNSSPSLDVGNSGAVQDPPSAEPATEGESVVQDSGQTIIVQPNSEEQFSNENLSPTENGSASSSTIGRILAVLTALMLVLGGVYILLRLNQRMNWIDRSRKRNDELEYANQRRAMRTGPTSVESHERTWQSSQGAQTEQPAGNRWPDPADVKADTEFVTDSFDDYDDKGEYQIDTGGDRDTDIGPVMLSPQAHAGSADPAASQEALIENEPSEVKRSFKPTSYPGWDDDDQGASSYRKPEERNENVLAGEDRFGGQANDWAVSPDSQIATQPRSSDSPARRITRGAHTRRELLSFTTHYVRGRYNDYEERHQIIMDSADQNHYGRNVGECGIGVNFKNGILQNKPHDVIALDVWLIDKTELESLDNVKRILLSEYAIDHDLTTVIQRENRSDGEPITPQTGLEFELQGNRLSLICQVLEATYVQNTDVRGIFESLQIQMTVYTSL